MTAKAKRPIQRHGCVERDMMCCGLGEYDGLNMSGFTAEGAVRAIAEDGLYGNNLPDREDTFCQVVMTQAIYRRDDGSYPSVREATKNLTSLVAYIKRYKLGTVVTAATEINPNSKNKVKAALFTPRPAAMTRWMKEHEVLPEETYNAWRSYW